MIRKFARVNAPAGALLDIFADSDRWPSWMPGVERSDVVQRSAEVLIVDIVQHQMGQRLKLRIESRFVGSTVRQHQVKGIFKRWQAVWSFNPSPSGIGTTVSCELDIDLGMMAMIAPARLVQKNVDRFFDDTIAGAEREFRNREAESTESESGGETLLEVFETQTGLEVWIAGRRMCW